MVNMFLSRSNNDIFLIGWVDYEPGYNFDDQKELEANRDNFVSGVNATLVSSKNIEYKTFKGLEFSAWGRQCFLDIKSLYCRQAALPVGCRKHYRKPFRK